MLVKVTMKRHEHKVIVNILTKRCDKKKRQPFKNAKDILFGFIMKKLYGKNKYIKIT